MTTCVIGKSPHTRDGRPWYWPLPGCACDWCKYQREQDRARYAYNTRNGVKKPTPEEVEQARERLRHWHDDEGIPMYRIAPIIGTWDSNLWRIMAKQRSPSRATYEAIMAVPWDFTMDQAMAVGRRGGALVDPTGTARRLQALNAIGFSYAWIGERLGSRGMGVHYSSIARGARSAKQGVLWETAKDIRELYETYSNDDPLKHGIRLASVNKLKIECQRKGYAPPICWDADTIDDPNAIAQWTGKCGTHQGYYMHKKAGLPACRPCLDAIAEYERERRMQRAETAKQLGESRV